MAEQPTASSLSKAPTMTPWFNPVLLGKLLWRVIVADLFGQYADRRLIVAALDPAADDELFARATQFMPGGDGDLPKFTPDANGNVWVDFVADLGDGFDATYAIASLLSQKTLSVGEHETTRGQLLVMGGDEVYPTASQKDYRKRLRDPYEWAFPDPGGKHGVPVYAIPGNHDWYDGLVVFLALFCRKVHLRLGGWRSYQRRSYFALQLTNNWWIWAMDAQLDDDVDQPQKDYFAAIAKKMPANTNVILCGPEPGWLYTLQQGNRSFSVIDYVGWQAVNNCKGVEVPFVISGDTHHYSRYEGDDKASQFVTSGGGGAFLHPTHQLKPTVDVDREPDGISWLGGRVRKLTLARTGNEDAVYPPRSASAKMLWGNLLFAAKNPGFAFFVLGAAYWLLGLASLYVLGWDGTYLVPLLFFLGFWGYTKNQEGGGLKVTVVSLANALVHTFAMWWIVNTAVTVNALLPPLEWHVAALLFALEVGVVGGAIGATLFGIYLLISSGLLNMNHNDAFSSLRLDCYRHFLRMKISGDEITVYPIGIDRTPHRTDWVENEGRVGNPAPKFVPRQPLAPRLIEPPFLVRRPHRAPKGAPLA